MNRLDELFRDRPSPAVYAARYLAYLQQLLATVSRDEIAAFVRALLDAREQGARIYFIGNGGSAATASHFANDLTLGTRSTGRPFRAMSLTDNSAVLTAAANDDGYAEIFTSQLKALMEPGDVVVAISASGNSPNIVQAVRWANDHGAVTVGLTGFDGGVLRTLAQLSVHVPTRAGEYGPVEDLHMVVDHLVTAYLRSVCDTEKEPAL
jgi:D-sedoheptulose 7-phosphate isomerase